MHTKKQLNLFNTLNDTPHVAQCLFDTIKKILICYAIRKALEVQF